MLKIFGPSTTKTAGNSFIPRLGRLLVKPKLFKSVDKILKQEKNIDVVFMIAIPLNQIEGLANQIRNHHRVPVIYYDLDVPSSLPSHGGFTFNYLKGADLGEYDSIIIPSEGSVAELRELGAREVKVVHFGVDPDVFGPLVLNKDIDFFFFGNDGGARENNLKMMISEPSKLLENNFIVSGRHISIDLGRAQLLEPLSFTEYRKYCSRAKVNLNVVRKLHADVYGTSTSRPFELASMQCCIVSAPYAGLEKWFDTNKEILIAKNSKECIELYKMLMDDDEWRTNMGTAARSRVLKEHTTKHRARQITEILKHQMQ
jgi:spore maturation protein CgeB